MLEKLKKNKGKIIWSALLILLLICVRAFESKLFYDPFLDYYRREFTHLPFPDINPVKLFLSYGFRFYINSVLSLGLLYVLFKDTKIVKFSIFLYMALASVLMISFFFVFTFFGEENKMTLFYIRRFIIQPIFILLFIPAFYYQNRIRKS